MTPLAGVTSLKVKLGLLVAVSVVVAAVVAYAGRASGVPAGLSIPVTILLALAVTQLLAVGMIAPLREMTAAAGRMARGDYAVRVTGAAHDEVGELARAFNTMARDLATVDRQRRDLVANVSHELRTPLAALRAVLENIVDDVEPNDPAAVAAALAQAERLSELVDDLLDLARVDAGRAALTPRPVPLADLLGTAVDEARLSGRSVTYDVTVVPADLEVRADPARLHQLVANLLHNASRHGPAGGTVQVRAVRDGDRYRLEVADEGPGVAARDRERVFEPFGTLSDTDGGGGTGLGLAIARWVTDLHGGTIRFVDRPPGTTGALVRVDLPLDPPDRPATVPAEEQTMVPPTPAPPAPAPARREPTPVPVPARPLLDDLFGAFWPARDVPARVPVLLAALGVGLLAAVVLPFRDAGIGTFVVLVAAGAVVLASSRHRRDPFTLGCAALCVLLAAISFLRDADWIIALSVLTGGLLCVAGSTRARTLPGFVAAAVAWPLAGLRGLPWLGRTLAVLTGLGQGAALLRTAVLSVTGLLVFGLLFASADALFAEWVGALVPDVSLDSFVLRAFLTVAVGGAVLAAAYLALDPPRTDRGERPARPVGHRFEWLAPVLVVDAVFVLFLVAQATVIFGGHAYLERTTGLTYADYVHQGFGQLTVATALTLLVVWAATRKAPRETGADRAWLRGSLGLLCLLTLVVVASALHRMHVYQDAYGFTTLRLVVDVFEAWLGLLVLATIAGGATLRARWLPRFALLSGAVAVLGLGLLDPEAWVARQNLDRYAASGEVDWHYLRGLSADAVPVLATLPDDVVGCALSGHRDVAADEDDWLGWNLGRSRARPLVEEHAVDGGRTTAPDDAACAAAADPSATTRP